jgi:hypothetical protein
MNCLLCKSVTDGSFNCLLIKPFVIWPSNSLVPTSYRCCSEQLNNTAGDTVTELFYKSLFGVSLDCLLSEPVFIKALNCFYRSHPVAFFNNIVIYSVNNTTYIGNQY